MKTKIVFTSRKNIIIKYIVAQIFATFLMLSANATMSCNGQIGYLGMDQIGQVNVGTGTAIHAICNMTSQGNFQITPQACKVFYATLLANRLAAKTVTIYYNDPSLTSCSQIGNWSVQPSAYFVEQTN